ncbi:MAG: hypothetical protein ACPG5U_05415 [Planktomarina sp.]
MTDPRPLAQTDLMCSSCAGQCSFDPKGGALICDSCGAGHFIAIDPDVDPSEEQPYDPDLPHTEQPRFAKEQEHRCTTCGGDVVFQGHSISEHCPYCDGRLVKHVQSESYVTLGIIPFAVSQNEAQTNAQSWVGKRWAAPDDLGDVVATSRVAGIYVPFWTFDSTETVDYKVWYRVKSGKQTVTRTKSGAMTTIFDDLLVPASHHVTPLIRDGILHEFDPMQLRPFDPAYLAGFAAERHHQSINEGLKANADDKDVLLRNRIKGHSGKSRITKVSYMTDTSGIKYRRILLPVWILHYSYKGKAMKVVTCGLRGRTFGERPFDAWKLFKLAMGLAGAIAAFGFIWGASGIY